MNYQSATANFLDYCKHRRGLSPLTIKAYRLDLRLFQNFISGNGRGFVALAVDEFLVKQHSLRPASRKRRLATLRSFGDFLVEGKSIKENPARKNSIRIKSGTRLPRVASLNNVKHLIEMSSEAARNCNPKMAKRGGSLMEAVIMDLLFSTGMRVTEVSHLRLGQIDLEGRRIMVQGKGNKERIIPIITGGSSNLLSSYLKSLKSLDQESFIFSNNRTRRLSEDSIRRILRKWCRKLSLPHLTPHMLRHTIATQLLNNGVDLRYIQRFMGHSSLNTTTIYAQVLDEKYEQRIRRYHPRKLFKIAG